MKEKIALYMHGGSKNHGCEAIVRTVAPLVNGNPVLFSAEPKDDIKYGLGNVCDVRGRRKLSTLLTRLRIKLGLIGDLEMMYGNVLKWKGTALSIGGDVYCYDPDREQLIYVNERLRRNGCKTALIGCSINPELLSYTALVDDLKGYDLITARESITYNALLNAGINKNVKLIPDSAFLLKAKETELPKVFEEKDVIGINASPFVLKYGDKDLMYRAFKQLIDYICVHTDLSIALIPHVVNNGGDDRETLRMLYDLCDDKTRVVAIDDMSVDKLKYVIGKCRFFIGARTHAVIAAYSSYVPTIAIGYSVKAKGIARDLFGTEEGYVVDVNEMNDENELKDAFVELWDNEDRMRDMLKNRIPFALQKAMRLADALKEI